MKKTLLFLTSCALFTSVNIFAQTKTWDFGNDRVLWPASAGYSTETIVDNLGIYPGASVTDFGKVTSGSWGTALSALSDTYSTTTGYRFQTAGTGIVSTTYSAAVAANDFFPYQRFLYFNVSGACTIKVWFKPGTNGTQRTLYVTDGTSLIGYGTTNTAPYADQTIATINYTNNSPKRLYIYSDNGMNLFKIEVTGATVSTTTLATSELASKNSISIFSSGSQVFVSKVSGDTKVNVYNTTGQLVKSFNTKSDTSFDLKPGLYIVNAKSDKGEKSQKVIVK